MKYKSLSKLWIKIYLIVVILFGIVGPTAKAQAATIKISNTSVTLETGKTKTLSIKGTSKKVTWYSSKKSVATVSTSGKITAKAPGSATITASVAGKKLYCKVTVKAPIKISSTATTLEAGSTKTLKITGTSGKVTWYSSNKSVATVSTSGKITAKAPGSATITASVAGKKLYCKVTVKAPIKISSTATTLEAGSTKTLKITGTSSKVTWYSSKKSVATVSSGGKITARAPGTATITASVAGKKLYCKVTVKAPTVTNKPTVTPTAPTSTPVVTPAVTPVPIPVMPKKVVGYYAAWSRYSGYTPDKLDASKLTHINYAFANIGSDNKIALGYPDIDPYNIQQLNSLKKAYPHLKTLIAVGGWTWSGRFSDIALTKESREIFADSCVDFIVKYGFDGVDIDWEYPVSGGLSTNIKRPEDKQNFTLLLKILREKLDARGDIDKKHYILSFAGAAGNWYINNTELNQLQQYVDYANIMTYDIHGTWEPYTNFNAPLYGDLKSGIPQNRISVDSSVQAWLNAGFPKDKLIMGVPFYGFIYKAVAPENSGYYQTYSGGASISYYNITQNYLNNSNYVRHFHPEAMVPWLFNGDTFITYEDKNSMEYKANYIKSMGLGGVMIWELSQDPDKILLDVLSQSINQQYE